MKLIDEDRGITYRIVGGVAAIIVGWAILHDQIIVQIAPEHFTEYHEPVGKIENPYLLALLWAIAATFGPGLILGMVYAYLGRHGERTKVPVRYILVGTLRMVLLTGVVSLLTGWWVNENWKTFYPVKWYPETEIKILITQTMQISAYLVSAVLSTAFGFLIWGRRRMLCGD